MNKLLLILGFLAGLLCFAQEDVVILAMVGDEIITSTDLQLYISDAVRGQSAEKVREIRKAGLEALINKELVYLEFKRLKGQVPQDYLQRQINAQIDRITNGDVEQFEQELYKQGLTMKEHRDRVAKNIAVDLLTRDRISKGISFSEEAVKKYYDSHPQEFQVKRQVRIAVIQLKLNGKYADKTPQTFEEIYKKLGEGEDFADLAKEYSEGSRAEDGGDQGWQEALAPALEEKIAKMEIGETDPVPICLGSSEYMVKLLGRSGASMLPLDETRKAQIRTIMTREEEDRRYNAFIKELYIRFPVSKMIY